MNPTPGLPPNIRECEKHGTFGSYREWVCDQCKRDLERGGGVEGHAPSNLSRGGSGGRAPRGDTRPMGVARPLPNQPVSSPARRVPPSRPGKAAEDALAAALEGADYWVWLFNRWLRETIRGGMWTGADFIVREFPWGLALDPPRKFRSDFAVPGLLLLIEIDGGAHAAGRKKVKTDTERRGLAAAFGWRILAVTPEQVKDGTALELVRAALGEEDR